MGFRGSLKVLLVCGLITGAGYVQAQEFDLDAAVAFALKNNPDLNAVQQQLNASSAQTEISRAGHNATLSVSHTARLSDNPLDAFADKLNTRQVIASDFNPELLNQPGSSDLYFTQLALRWPVYTGGRVSAMVEDAEQMEKNRRLQYQYARQKMVYSTSSAYLTILATEQALRIADDAVSAAKQHVKTTSKLASEGRIVESDKLAAEVNLAAIRSQREQAATRYRSALDQFKLVIGLPLNTEITLAAATVAAISDDKDVNEYSQYALVNRKDLAAARALTQAAKARVDAARSVRKPSIELVASSNWYDDTPGFDSQSSSIMGVLSFDLYDGKNTGKIDLALAQQREMQWQLQALEQSVQKQVRDAYNALLESRERLTLASDNVKTAQRTVQLIKQRYGQGRTILLDLLQAERLYTDARTEQLTASLNLDLARVALPLASGALSLAKMVTP
ncbi:MAG: TolC family protein [Gammaproteobacteria bacterium]|nr:TolC family protein [Gammaproteobacteria bacterium]